MNKKGFVFGAMIEILSYFLIILILVLFVFFFKGSAIESQQIHAVSDEVYHSNLLNGYLSSRVNVDGVDMSVSDVISMLEPIEGLEWVGYFFGFYRNDITILHDSAIKYFVRPDSDVAYSINVITKDSFYYLNGILTDEEIIKSILFPNKNGIVNVVLVKGKVKDSILDQIKGERDAFLKANDYNAYLVKKNSESRFSYKQSMDLFTVISKNPTQSTFQSNEYKLLTSWTILDYSYIVDELPFNYLKILVDASNEFSILPYNLNIDSDMKKIRELLGPIPVVLPQGGTFGGTQGNLHEVPSLILFKGLSLKIYEHYTLGRQVGPTTHKALYCEYTGIKGGKCPNE